MLFLHEVHSVAGAREEEVAAAFRDPGGWMDLMSRDDDARLLWYLDHVHGTGPAYVVVTITAVRDGAAWERLAERVRDGDLREWVGRLDALRHDAVSKLLQPVPWSAMHEIDLSSVPVSAQDHDLVLFMEDTANPFEGGVLDYIEVAGKQYAPSLVRPNPLLQMAAAFQPAFGTGRRREIILWQRVLDTSALLRLLTTQVPPQMKAPGTWMHDALAYRDQWTSRLLRTSAWSPLA